jgi:hypothetical protein
MNKNKKAVRPPIEYQPHYQHFPIDEIREALEGIEERRRDENMLLLGILWQLQRIGDALKKRRK